MWKRIIVDVQWEAIGSSVPTTVISTGEEPPGTVCLCEGNPFYGRIYQLYQQIRFSWMAISASFLYTEKHLSGREIADLLLAVNRPYGKSDYIPCIAWGRNARYASGFEVGTRVQIWGRVQSKEYTKKILSETQLKSGWRMKFLSAKWRLSRITTKLRVLA